MMNCFASAVSSLFLSDLEKIKVLCITSQGSLARHPKPASGLSLSLLFMHGLNDSISYCLIADLELFQIC